MLGVSGSSLTRSNVSFVFSCFSLSLYLLWELHSNDSISCALCQSVPWHDNGFSWCIGLWLRKTGLKVKQIQREHVTITFVFPIAHSMLIQARERPRAEIFPLHSLRFTDLRESNPVTIPATPLFYDGFTATQITCETPVEMTYMLKLGNSW